MQIRVHIKLKCKFKLVAEKEKSKWVNWELFEVNV